MGLLMLMGFYFIGLGIHIYVQLHALGTAASLKLGLELDHAYIHNSRIFDIAVTWPFKKIIRFTVI